MPDYDYFYTLFNLPMWTNIKSLFNLKGDLFLLSILLSIPLFFVLDANNQFWGLIPVSGSVTILIYTFLATVVSFFLLLYILASLEKAIILLAFYLTWFLFFKTIQVKLTSVALLSFIGNLGYYFAITILLLLLLTVFVYR